MQDALERISRKLVNAENASRIHDFVCPECGAPVILRAGYERTAYFAHASGLSDEDCARYAAGFGNTAAQELAGVPHDYIEALQLQLRIKRNGAEYGWALEIAVPTYRVNYGSIVIDVGGRTSEVNLEGNTSLYRPISAVPQESPYRVVEVKPSYSRLSSLDKTCAALDSKFATVFGPIDRPDATGIRRSVTFQPERTYAFIWAETCSPTFPEELTVEALTPREKWFGALVAIPHQISSDCFTWLEQFTQLTFVKAAPAIVPVWPPLIRSVSALQVETLPNHIFNFFVEHPAGTLPPPVFARSAQSERVAKADLHNAPLYELSPEGAKSVQLVCSKGPRLDVDFQLDVTRLKSIRPEVVKLAAVDRDGKAVESVLHSSESSGWFSQIRSGELIFKAMTLPAGAKGQVKVRRNAEWISELELVGDGVFRISPDSVTNASADLANQLIRIILDQTRSVMVDFSALGRALILGSVTSAIGEEVEVSSFVLKRIRQYFLQFPEVLPIGSRWKRLSDSQVISEFRRSQPTLQSLAHYRFIKTIYRENGSQYT